MSRDIREKLLAEKERLREKILSELAKRAREDEFFEDCLGFIEDLKRENASLRIGSLAEIARLRFGFGDVADSNEAWDAINGKLRGEIDAASVAAIMKFEARLKEKLYDASKYIFEFDGKTYYIIDTQIVDGTVQEVIESVAKKDL